MIFLLAAIGAVAAGYQLLALAACLQHLRKPRVSGNATTGISVLKPVHGCHTGFDEALRSHAEQAYPEFELLLGYGDPQDPALPAIHRAIAEHPGTAIRAVLCTREPAANRKVGVLAELAEHARYPVVVVNDADIIVPPGYLREVTAPLSNPQTGLVTCVYRAEADSWPGRWEALGVSTDFAPSALVAPLVGVSEFGMGSTLAFRRPDLDRIGGFEALKDYLADDYQLGAKLHRLGRINLISRCAVRTRLHDRTWRGVWHHQLRWARTIRLSRPGGYAGLPVTFASLWAFVAAASGAWWIALPLFAVRFATAITAGWFVLGSADTLKLFFLIPLRDLYGAAVWVAGLTGSTVEWGGEILRLDREGRITGKIANPLTTD